jgi:D-alanyl-lipoteichoic acid acyltransferase DltB (MBOAT superfamily)
LQFLALNWFGWMAGTVAVYWLSPPGIRDFVLAAITFAFLGWYSPLSAALLAGMIVVTYWGAGLVAYNGWRALALLLVIVSTMVTFKLRPGAGTAFTGTDLVIPLGLSYYTFRAMHYAIERYKGKLPPHGFADFVWYMAFLPTIVVGPIHRFPQFHRDRLRRRWSADGISAGLERILYGYVKIAVLCNVLVLGVFDRFIGELTPGHVSLQLYLGIVQSGLRLYLLFSGYSDIAIGFSRLLGFTVIENFNWPYLARNIAEFWRRWHISLTSFVRDYLFDFVTAATRRPALGMMVSLVLIGLWHEVSLRYLLWGVYHGIGVAVWHQFQHVKPMLGKPGGPALQFARNALSTLLTVHFVWFGFVLVEQPTFAAALNVYRQIFLGWIG